MNDIKIFENKEFGKIRVQEINGKPYFVGKDVCMIFGDTNHRRSLGRIDEEDKSRLEIIDRLGRKQIATMINESGLYALLFAMQPRKAHNNGGSDEYPIEINERIEKLHKFKRWVTSEVLPSICKNGGYIQNQENLSDSELVAKALLIADKQIKDRNRIIEEQKPKVLFADSVSASKNSILVGDLSKMIKQNGIDIGRDRLFEWLRNNGYLGKKGLDYNKPTQKSMDLKLFELKPYTKVSPNGSIITYFTPYVTGKGQIYFINKFLGDENANI